MVAGPGSSHETPGFPEKVLGEMLGDRRGVLGENIRVGGILKCHSLTRRFVLLRQERRDRRKVVGVRLGCMWSWKPPLYRKYIREKEVTKQLWKSLQTQGWKPLKAPAWGAAADV